MLLENSATKTLPLAAFTMQCSISAKPKFGVMAQGL